MRIRSLLKIVCLPLALGVLAACSSSNGNSAAVLDSAGKHVAGTGYSSWVQQHWLVYKTLNTNIDPNNDNTSGIPTLPDNTMCTECHGADLAGGTSGVSCFTPSFNGTACHANTDKKLGHPSGWESNASVAFHGYNANVKGNTALNCGLCHATGDADSTAVGKTASCAKCHTTSPVATPSGCTSCHVPGTAMAKPGAGDPTSPGAHYKHLSLPGVTCFSCHSDQTGRGIDVSPNHDSQSTPKAVNVVIDATYNAKTGSANFSYVGNYLAGNCSNASCHGGALTPAWNVATDTGINLSTTSTAADCQKCHVISQTALDQPQYNSPYSGNFSGNNEHYMHVAGHSAVVDAGGNTVNGNAQCADCHDLTLLTGANAPTFHFANIGSQAFKNPAATILQNNANGIGTYNLSPDKTKSNCSNVSCHPALLNALPNAATGLTGAPWKQ